jgi:hypothetical protein
MLGLKDSPFHLSHPIMLLRRTGWGSRKNLGSGV